MSSVDKLLKSIRSSTSLRSKSARSPGSWGILLSPGSEARNSVRVTECEICMVEVLAPEDMLLLAVQPLVAEVMLLVTRSRVTTGVEISASGQRPRVTQMYQDTTQSSLKLRLYMALSTVFSIFFQSDRRWMNSYMSWASC
jgi:hypothetical protein